MGIQMVEFRNIDSQFNTVCHKEHFYHKCGMVRNNITYYRCARTREFGCKATLKITISGQITTNNVQHNHPPKDRSVECNLKRKKIIYAGHTFYKHTQTAQKIHWRCSKFRTSQCIVRLHTDKDGAIRSIRGSHNHPPDTKN